MSLLVLNGVIHLVRTHEGGRGGQAKAYAMRTRGEGGLHMEARTQKRPFLHVFCDIFICWKLLPCLVVIGVDFHYRFIKVASPQFQNYCSYNGV